MRMRVVLTVIAAVVLSGCATVLPPKVVGRDLGSLQYLVDLDVRTEPTTDVLIGEEIDEMADVVEQEYEAPDLAEELREIPHAASVVVAYYYDGCTRHGPELRLDGAEVTVGFATVERGKACARPVDTLTFIEVPWADLPDPVHFALCGPDPITIESGRKSGAISYRMC